jgi:uncharacterized protein YndB with AHSA1/START domain
VKVVPLRRKTMGSTTVERAIQGSVLVNASLDEVWAAWTTEEGVRSFFAPACNVDLRPDGPYEIFFNPDAPPGERGGEGLRVMAVQPKKMLSFTWNAPPSLPEAREQRTHVVLRFDREGQNLTQVTLHHDGWGLGGGWDESYAYFERAWNSIVLPRLKYRFEHGPIDWEDPPDMEELAGYAK